MINDNWDNLVEIIKDKESTAFGNDRTVSILRDNINIIFSKEKVLSIYKPAFKGDVAYRLSITKHNGHIEFTFMKDKFPLIIRQLDTRIFMHYCNKLIDYKIDVKYELAHSFLTLYRKGDKVSTILMLLEYEWSNISATNILGLLIMGKHGIQEKNGAFIVPNSRDNKIKDICINNTYLRFEGKDKHITIEPKHSWLFEKSKSIVLSAYEAPKGEKAKGFSIEIPNEIIFAFLTFILEIPPELHPVIEELNKKWVDNQPMVETIERLDKMLSEI